MLTNDVGPVNHHVRIPSYTTRTALRIVPVPNQLLHISFGTTRRPQRATARRELPRVKPLQEGREAVKSTGNIERGMGSSSIIDKRHICVYELGKAREAIPDGR